MSQLNLKFISALLIVCLGITEILVFNEEVFIFVCFFIFFNLISVLAGSSISQAFFDIGAELEKGFLQTSKEAKNAISDLVLSKTSALNSIVRVSVFLKAFRNIALQKSLLSVSESFVQSCQSCNFVLNAFKSSRFESIVNPKQAFFINSKNILKNTFSKNISSLVEAKGFFVTSTPTLKSRLVDRLLSADSLSSTKGTLS